MRILENPNAIVAVEVGRSNDTIVVSNNEREAEGVKIGATRKEVSALVKKLRRS